MIPLLLFLLALLAVYVGIIETAFSALMRLSRNRIASAVTGAWVDVFRNLPLILLIFFVALTLPLSWRQAWEDFVPEWAPAAFESGRVFGGLIGGRKK